MEISFFNNLSKASNFEIGIMIGLEVLLGISAFFAIFFIFKYFRDYQIFQSIYAKIRGNVAQFDRIKRMQMRQRLEESRNNFTREKKKDTFVQKFYRKMSMTGIPEKIPGFSELSMIAVMVFLTLTVFGVVTFLRTLFVGTVSALVFVIILWYTISLLIYQRKVSLERQLLQFTNACASASLQYSNIIDIFGAVYDQFDSPLRESLEACYIEAKQTNNKELALKHLEDRYNSAQFCFVIDNLDLCSSVTGDYHSAAKDITEPVALYSESYEKKRTLLRNAKLNITIMFFVSLGLLYSLSVFLGDLKNIIMQTTIGNLSILALILIFFYGMNMKAGD